MANDAYNYRQISLNCSGLQIILRNVKMEVSKEGDTQTLDVMCEAEGHNAFMLIDCGMSFSKVGNMYKTTFLLSSLETALR